MRSIEGRPPTVRRTYGDACFPSAQKTPLTRGHNDTTLTQHFDSIVIGTGQAGTSLAGRLTDAGQRIAFVERNLSGGTCVNTRCIPTKTLVGSAYAAQM
jgi:heterodisulfide reductase subunit A-like polyferredoxin